MSGKKIITYDGRQIHHSDDMSRTFSHSWFEGDHALRVDITDIVEVGRGRNDKMYELTVSLFFLGLLLGVNMQDSLVFELDKESRISCFHLLFLLPLFHKNSWTASLSACSP